MKHWLITAKSIFVNLQLTSPL